MPCVKPRGECSTVCKVSVFNPPVLYMCELLRILVFDALPSCCSAPCTQDRSLVSLCIVAVSYCGQVVYIRSL